MTIFGSGAARTAPGVSRRAVAGLLALPSLVLLCGLAAVALTSLGRPLSSVEVALTTAVAALPLATPWLLRWRGVIWDPVLGGAVFLLCSLSVVTVARVEPDLLSRQLLWIVLGWAAMLGALAAPGLPERLRRYKYTWLSCGLLLALVTLAFGRDINGSGVRLWLQLGPATIQPSELLRVLLAVFLAAYLDERRDLLTAVSQRWGPLRLPPLPYLLPLLIMLGLTLLMLVVQRDLGPALLYFGTFLAMIYVATGRRSYVVSGMALFALAGVAGYALSAHIRRRFMLWLDPWSDPQGGGFQSLQALGGLASGGVAGSGPGSGYPTLIPAAHTDYPLAVIGEEWGLLGVFAVIMLYAVIVTRFLAVAMILGHDRFAQLLAAGLGLSLGMQAFIILGGALRLIPLTGITAPFLSYGGSSMVMAFVALGLLVRFQDEGSRPERGASWRSKQSEEALA